MKREVARDIHIRLREFRAAANWTQRDLGEEVGRRLSAISEWENGKRRVPLGLLEAVANRYRFPVDVFLERGPRPAEFVKHAIVRRGSSESTVGGVESRESAEGAGWMFGDPSEAEEQFRTYIRNIERTHRMMVADPSAFPADGIRRVQLDAVRLAMDQCELGGRPVPEFLHRVRNELIQGVFR